ncbi:hypothetical protein KJ059_08420 [Myxococcota bacterium]|nr:hypothetical protein [Myxococcota bacterium]MCZ7619952.1 hypothetical protein [Myxococcota bacterium]
MRSAAGRAPPNAAATPFFPQPPVANFPFNVYQVGKLIFAGREEWQRRLVKVGLLSGDAA